MAKRLEWGFLKEGSSFDGDVPGGLSFYYRVSASLAASGSIASEAVSNSAHIVLHCGHSCSTCKESKCAKSLSP